MLSFAFANFRSFSGEAVLDLTSRSLRTNVPRQGQTWLDVTERVAAIYGANAAGKSTVLDAMIALSEALKFPGGGSIYQPSKSGAGPREPVRFEVEFVAQGVRHRYEVEAESWGIAREALYSYPKASERMLFVRSQAGEDEPVEVTAGGTLTGPTAEVRKITRPRMLFLATAHRYGHRSLAPVASALVAGVGVEHITFRDRQDDDVLHRVVMEMVADPETQVDLLKALVQAADLGIDGIEIREEEVSAEQRQQLIRILKALDDGDEVDEEKVPRLRDVLVFRHTARDGQIFELPVSRESSGTITWLTTAWHALDALRQGSLLLIDELDASLHPDLARFIVELFLNRELNSQGAQLVFTSHDVSLLGNAPVRLLHPQHVWFVEKSVDAGSELYSLADFENREGNNSERRYLAGKFGAVPRIDDRLLSRAVAIVGHRAEVNDG